MEVMPKEKRVEKGSIPKVQAKAPIIKHNPQEPIASSMNPDQEKMLLKEILGNYSDQTGAYFG